MFFLRFLNKNLLNNSQRRWVYRFYNTNTIAVKYTELFFRENRLIENLIYGLNNNIITYAACPNSLKIVFIIILVSKYLNKPVI